MDGVNQWGQLCVREGRRETEVDRFYAQCLIAEADAFNFNLANESVLIPP